MTKSGHEFWMRRALELAERGRFRASPNPLVGACLVRGGKLAGEGYHACYGEEHAEVAALRDAGKKARGASLYVTLEPCATWGKTPPCVQAILDAGVREVFIAALDPNPKNHGKGQALLRSGGVRVISGLLAREAVEQNEAFFKRIRTGLPFVTLKMAQSLDGKIAAVTGQSRWITSRASREYVHLLRAESDAVLVGKKTWMRDDPRLTTHLSPSLVRQGRPWRLLLDPRGEAPPSLRVFRGSPLTIRVVSEKQMPKIMRRVFQKNSQNLLPVGELDGRLDLKDLLVKLGQLGVGKLLVEGGGETAWSFLKAGLVDRLVWMVAPKILGGRGAVTSVEGEGVLRPSKAFTFKITKTVSMGGDLLIEARKHRG